MRKSTDAQLQGYVDDGVAVLRPPIDRLNINALVFYFPDHNYSQRIKIKDLKCSFTTFKSVCAIATPTRRVNHPSQMSH